MTPVLQDQIAAADQQVHKALEAKASAMQQLRELQEGFIRDFSTLVSTRPPVHALPSHLFQLPDTQDTTALREKGRERAADYEKAAHEQKIQLKPVD